MTETIELGDISIVVVHKKIKNVHLTVHPPEGRITLSVPATTHLEVARAYAITKLGWMRAQREMLHRQARESRRDFVERESHYLWGRRYLLTVTEEDARPSVTIGHKYITLCVRPGSDRAKRAQVIYEWQKSLLHELIPTLIAKWETILGVRVRAYYLQRMKTRWGSCNSKAGNIRLNTELVKKTKDLVEYVVVHEMIHLLEATHSERFFTLLCQHYPSWSEARAELNDLPLSSSV